MKPLEWFFLFVLYTVDKNLRTEFIFNIVELRK
ncbi:hypothetical protein ACT7DH_06720 [Bacillus pacificus]